jgi:voltage-gated sodium channel
VRSSIKKAEPYNVIDFYAPTGLYSFVAAHPIFENVTLGVISFNALWMGVDTDLNESLSLLNAHPVFQIAEQFFCIYFSFELFVRFMSFETKLPKKGAWLPRWSKDAWFMFDSVLVTLMVLETWIFTMMEVLGGGGKSPLEGKGSILRLFRLLRLSRLMRMLRSLPELMILVKGMATAMKSVSYVVVLLLLCLYVFAIAITQLAAGTENIYELYFTSVQDTIYALLIYGTFLDNFAQFCDDILADSAVILAIVAIFVSIACLCVLNMLIGVLCDVIQQVADKEREDSITVRVSEKMHEVVESLDSEGDKSGTISLDEFKSILYNNTILDLLDDVGIDAVSLVDFAELFFYSDTGEQVELDFDTFMEMVLDLRGSNNACVKDVLNLWKQLSPKLTAISTGVGDFESVVMSIEGKIDTMDEVGDTMDRKLNSILENLDEKLDARLKLAK